MNCLMIPSSWPVTMLSRCVAVAQIVEAATLMLYLKSFMTRIGC